MQARATFSIVNYIIHAFVIGYTRMLRIVIRQRDE